MKQTHTFSKGEEIANAITHGIGAILSIAALVILIVFSSLHGSALHVVSFTIYGVTMLLLYVSSTLVHAFPKGKVKDLFEIFDHSAIYLFIAGSYMPILFIVVGGSLSWILFGISWGIAIVGVVFKSFFVKKYLVMSTVMYILMGWLAVFVLKPIFENMELTGVVMLFVGGMLYTLGTIFYIWRKFPYHHAVWHLFVLAGSAVHFFMVIFYILPIKV